MGTHAFNGCRTEGFETYRAPCWRKLQASNGQATGIDTYAFNGCGAERFETYRAPWWRKLQASNGRATGIDGFSFYAKQFNPQPHRLLAFVINANRNFAKDKRGNYIYIFSNLFVYSILPRFYWVLQSYCSLN